MLSQDFSKSDLVILRTTVSQCNTTGHAQCCNVVGRYNDPSVTAVASHIGVAVTAVDAVVGLLCSPIGALEAGGVKW